MKKIDIHMHIAAAHRQVDGAPAMQLSTAAEMRGHMHSLGIEKAVLMSCGERVGSFANNEECETASRTFPDDFAWMCNLDFHSRNTVYTRLLACRRRGAVGVGELMINKRFDNAFIESIFDAAQSLALPVLFHISPEEGVGYGLVDEPGLPLLECALQKYPNLIFIGHSQPFWHEITAGAAPQNEARNSWGKGPALPGGRVPDLMAKYPNLYADLSANSGGCAVMRDEAFGLNFLEEFSQRLLFGTDMTNTQTVYPLGAWLDEHYAQGQLSQAAYQSICGENAKRVLFK